VTFHLGKEGKSYFSFSQFNIKKVKDSVPKKKLKPDLVVHIYNPSQEADAEGS
jgi:hypothetical protein